MKNNQETTKIEENVSVNAHFTIDHRYLDGYLAAQVGEDVRLNLYRKFHSYILDREIYQ
jgi:hypothetical protein